MNESVSRAGFPTTRWSRVVDAVDPAGPAARPALAELCGAYWYPIYAFIRRKGHGPDEALDLTQDYFTRLLETGVLASADQRRGRFRAFLRTDCGFFLSHHHEQRRALKRGGDQTALPIDARDAEGRYLREPVDATTPERLFDQAWALNLLDEVLKDLAREYAETRPRRPVRDPPGRDQQADPPGLVRGPRRPAGDDRGGGPAGRAAAPQAVQGRSSASGSPRRSTNPTRPRSTTRSATCSPRSRTDREKSSSAPRLVLAPIRYKRSGATSELSEGPEHARKSLPELRCFASRPRPGRPLPALPAAARPRQRCVRPPRRHARPAREGRARCSRRSAPRSAGRAPRPAPRHGDRRGALAGRPARERRRMPRLRYRIDGEIARGGMGSDAEGSRPRPRPRRRDQGAPRGLPRQRRHGPPVRRGGADRRPAPAPRASCRSTSWARSPTGGRSSA